jgi:hypothetical protein
MQELLIYFEIVAVVVIGKDVELRLLVCDYLRVEPKLSIG